MAYSAIPDANITNGSPLRDVDLFSLRDNPIAIAEMETAAPKPVSAAGSVRCWLESPVASVSVGSYSSTNSYNDATSSIGVRVYATGVVSVGGSHFVNTSGTSFFRVVNNGVLVQEWSTTSTSVVPRTVDVSVSFGDVLTLQSYYTGGASGRWSTKFVDSDRDIYINSTVGV